MNIDELLELLSIIGWVLFGIYIAFSFLGTMRRQSLGQAIARLFSLHHVLALLVALGIQLISASLIFIEPQERGVIITILNEQGFREDPLPSGLRWKYPLIEQVKIYPIYWQTYTMSGRVYEGNVDGNDAIIARTSDGQEVLLDVSVVFRLDPEQVVQVHIDWQDRYVEDLVRPFVRSIVRSQVSAFTVDEVNSQKRQNLEADLNRIFEQELRDRGLILDEFLLRNITFSPEYATAVEQKQVAFQQVTQGEYEAERLRRLAEGRGDEIEIVANKEAEALRLIKAALEENQELLLYRYIEKLSPNIQVMLVPSETPFLLPLPTPSASANLDETADPETTESTGNTSVLDETINP